MTDWAVHIRSHSPIVVISVVVATALPFKYIYGCPFWCESFFFFLVAAQRPAPIESFKWTYIISLSRWPHTWVCLIWTSANRIDDLSVAVDEFIGVAVRFGFHLYLEQLCSHAYWPPASVSCSCQYESSQISSLGWTANWEVKGLRGNRVACDQCPHREEKFNQTIVSHSMQTVGGQNSTTKHHRKRRPTRYSDISMFRYSFVQAEHTIESCVQWSQTLPNRNRKWMEGETNNQNKYNFVWFDLRCFGWSGFPMWLQFNAVLSLMSHLFLRVFFLFCWCLAAFTSQPFVTVDCEMGFMRTDETHWNEKVFWHFIPRARARRTVGATTHLIRANIRNMTFNSHTNRIDRTVDSSVAVVQDARDTAGGNADKNEMFFFLLLSSPLTRIERKPTNRSNQQ